MLKLTLGHAVGRNLALHRKIDRRNVTTFYRGPIFPLWLKLSLFGVAVGGFTYYYAFDSRASMHRHLSMPLVRAFLDAEQSHYFTVQLARRGLVPRDRVKDDDCLKTEFCGMEMSNPVGIGAGFDKHGEAIDGCLMMGFGMVEIGSVTPEPQPGNPKPRLFRLEEDKGAINRFGFNSVGEREVHGRLRWRLANFLRQSGLALPDITDYTPKSLNHGRVLGINLGKNKSSPVDSNDDYVRGMKSLGPYADYVVVNISSPNTPGLRDLQKKDFMKQLLKEVKKARDELEVSHKPVLFVKLAPDLTSAELSDIAAIVRDEEIDGVIIGNTTIQRMANLKSDPDIVSEKGGLSGNPLKPLGLQKVKEFYRITEGRIPIIGCGGISNGQDALDYLEAGASALQIYTSIAYEGPGVVREIKDFLVETCQNEGIANIKEVVGRKCN